MNNNKKKTCVHNLINLKIRSMDVIIIKKKKLLIRY